MQEDPNKITYFAATNSRGQDAPFGIKRKDRARHMYVIGKTGMGKSTLLENMAIQDIRNGEGIAFIDPHGSTADRIMEYVPEHRIKDVVYFAPFDMDHPVAFNVMEDVGYDKRHLVVSGLITAFKKLWVDAFSARMEYILSNTLLALLEYPGATMLDVNRMLVEKGYRKNVVDNIKDTIVKKFWTEEFANYTDRYTQEATPAIQNKVGQFTSNPLIRNIIGQAKSSFDIRQLMDEKKILIINLSKGRVGEVNAALLGSMLVTKIYLAAMSRADVPAATLAMLPNFYFYVDEFQNFANESFADILSEARKYKLNLLIAHQYVEQMEEEVRDAVFGNVGTTVCFRVGPFDAEVLETVFAPQFEAKDLVNLGFAQIYLTLMIDGVGSPPFSATTLPPFDPPPKNFTEEVLKNSREQFGNARADVEATIAKTHEDGAAMEKPKEVKRPTSDYAPRPKPAASATHTSTVGSHAPSAPAVHPPAPRPATPLSASLPPRPPEYDAPAKPQEHTPPVRATEMPRAEERRQPLPPRPSRPMPPRPAEAQKPRPPLSGATSLREALSQVTQKPPLQGNASDLKSVLHTVAPKAEAPPKEEPKPAELPPEELKRMLAVDEADNEAWRRDK